MTHLNDSNAQWLGQLVTSPVAIETYLRAIDDPASMTREDRFRFNMIVLQAMRSGEAMLTQTQWGLVDDDHWLGMRATIKQLMGSDAGRRAFETNRGFVSPQFADEVERILSEIT